MTENANEQEIVSSTDEQSSSTTLNAIAAHLCMSRQSYHALRKNLNIPVNATMDQAREIYIRHLREIAGNTGVTSENKKDLSSIKVRQEQEKLRKLQLANDRMTGKLLDAAEVERNWNAILGALRTKLLAMPNNVSPHLAACADYREVKECLTNSIHEAMTDLVEFDVEEYLKEQFEEEEKTESNTGPSIPTNT